MEGKGFVLSGYAVAGGWNLCWYCQHGGEGFARYEVSRSGFHTLIAHVCPSCTPRAERGEREGLGYGWPKLSEAK